MNSLVSGEGQPVRELLPAFAEEWACDQEAAVELVMFVALIHERLDEGQALRRVLKELSESEIHLWRHKAAYLPLYVRGTRLESWVARQPAWAHRPALFVLLPVLLFLRLRVWLSFSISEIRRRGS